MNRKTTHRRALSKTVLVISFLALMGAFGMGFASTPHSNSTFVSKNYKDLMVEHLGMHPTSTENWPWGVYVQLFYSPSNKIAIDANSSGTLKYIHNKHPDQNDIRSEGMSYGMMAAVMFDDQEMFDALWGFVRTYMDSGNWYAWQLRISDFGPIDTNPAPDGEEYFAMALFFAHNRWGSSSCGECATNYEHWANDTLDRIRDYLWNDAQHQIIFSPSTSPQFTDPSYHLPAFYELFQIWDDKSDNFWADAADVSRQFLVNSAHSTTGLHPAYANFDGSPHRLNDDWQTWYSWDSYRVIFNMAIDHYWWSQSSQMNQQIEKLHNFFEGQNVNLNGPRDYSNLYQINGTPEADNNPLRQSIIPQLGPTERNIAQVAMNAAGALGSDDLVAGGFMQDIREQVPPYNDRDVYYDGLLWLFSTMALSGHFRIWEDLAVEDLDISHSAARYDETTGAPIFHSAKPYYFTGASCKDGSKPSSYTWSADFDSGFSVNGTMWPMYNGRYKGTIPASTDSSQKGAFELQVTRVCGGTTHTHTEDGYVDPSGYVRTVEGEPIPHALVELYRSDSDTAAGPYSLVTDLTLLHPYNKNNPDFTDIYGYFGWDVEPGFYKVRASKETCVNPNNRSQSYVETPPLEVPPPVTDLDLRLECTENGVFTDVEVVNDWGSGYCANVKVTNGSSQPVDWFTRLEVEGTVYDFWNVNYKQKNNFVTAEGLGWNNMLAPGASTNSLGFCADRTSPTPSEYEIKVRARGTSGTEIVKLTVGGNTIAQWTLSSSFKVKTFSTNQSGGINIEYINDYGYNRDVVVDYLEIGGIRHEAEDQTNYSGSASGTGNCATGHNDGWLHCNGYIGFSAYK